MRHKCMNGCWSILAAWFVVGMAVAPIARGDGVTIITHGYNPSVAGAPAWPASLRSDIAANKLGGEALYGTITVTGSAGALVATCSPWNYNMTNSTNAEVLVVVDWSAVADHLTTRVTAQSVATAVVARIIASQNGQPALAELPIHLVGHSRGGGMVCEIARQLGEKGVVVDHLTPLDPHPLTAADTQPVMPPTPVLDTPAAIYQNVVFADVYYQTAASPTGQYLSGAYNRLWSSTLAGGYYNNTPPNNTYADHRNILLAYQATVNPSASFSNGEATLGATERAAWFNAYEASGTNTGISYSRIDGRGVRTSTNTPVAGGDAVRAGLNNASVFGGGGVRSNLTWSAAVWPNVAQLDVLTNGTALGSGACQITIGTTPQLRCVYLDYDSGCTVTLRLDADRNPYNSNDVAVISTQVVATASGGSYTPFTNTWNTAGLTSGTTGYVYAQVTDGTRTRYFYAVPVLQFTALSAPAPLVTITNPPGDMAVAYTTTVITLTGTNNAAVTGTQWWTNTLNAANGTFAAASPWTVASIPLAVGANPLRVYGTNSAGVQANAAVTITRAAAPPAPLVTYVAPGGANVWPYATWADAATTIQAAVDAVATNGTVWVTNGVYATGGAPNGSPAISNRVCITNDITVQSVNGASVTFIKGAADPATGGLGTNATRCVFMSAGSITGFTLTNGYTRTDSDWNTQQGGGGALLRGGVISNCVVTACVSSHFAGGLDLFGGDAWNCIILGNSSYDGGGLALQGSQAFNCLVRNNRASNRGGGVFFWQTGTLGNSTVAGNSATNSGGGAYCYQGGTNLNSIIYSNTVGGAVGNWTTNAGGVFAYTCTTPHPGGTGNITNNPLFVNALADDFHLQTNSPCIDKGANAYASGDRDLDGNPRIGGAAVDLGAYESMGAPMVNITNASVTVSESTTNYTMGGTNNAWVVGTMSWSNAATGVAGTLAATSTWSIAGIALVRGANSITVSGTNAAGAVASDSVTITRDRNAGPGSLAHYVWTNSPATAWPYTNWTTAAHTIQEAVETADTNDTVWVTNGVYDVGGVVQAGYRLTNRVLITRSMTVQSVNGADDTVIVGAADAATNGPGAVRCLCLMADAVVRGFTLTNGHTDTAGDIYHDQSGGGAFSEVGSLLDACTLRGNGAAYHGGGVFLTSGGVLTNCTLTSNEANNGYGGGAYVFSGGTLVGCLISSNAAYAGGGLYLHNGGTLERSTLNGNRAEFIGGGAVCVGTAIANNCLMHGNAAQHGGGAHLEGGGHLSQCTLSSNTVSGEGSGVECNWGGTLTNCIVYGNVPGDAANLHGGYTAAYCCSPGLSGSGNITNDPQFVDAGANNFRLPAGSPCINAGNNASAQGATDLDGNPRVIGGVLDMGAYECTSGSTASGILWSWLLQYGLATDGSADHLHSDTDTFDNGQEYIADTDPTNSASYFRVTAASNLPPWTVYFLSSTGRVYIVNASSNLVSGVWTNIPGAGLRTGTGGADSIQDTNVPPKGPFYRLKVELP